MFCDPWLRRCTAGAAGCYSSVCVSLLLKRAMQWGLLLGTAWASNSCDKCSSHGDQGPFFPNKQRWDVYLWQLALREPCLFALVTGQRECFPNFSFSLPFVGS